MRTLFYLLLTVVYINGLSAQDPQDKGETQRPPLLLTLQYPERVADLESKQIDRLTTKVGRILTNYGMGAAYLNTTLVIQPDIEIIDSKVMDGLRKLHVIDVEFSLFIGQKGSLHFSEHHQTIQGTGRTEKLAMNSILTKIKTQSSSLKGFFDGAREKIANYYRENCSLIVSDAEKMSSTDRNNDAITLLWSIPWIAGECHLQAREKILEYYKRAQNRNCRIHLNDAETHVAMGNYQAAAEIIVAMDPDANCYSKAMALKAKIQKATGKYLKRIWDLEDKRLEIAKNSINAHYQALSDMAKAKTVQSSSGEVREQRSPTSPPVADQRFAQFNLRSPIVGANGDAVVNGDRVTIQGYLDHHENTRALLIDKIETSWDENGSFMRTLLLNDPDNEISIELISNDGTSTVQKFRVKKSSEPVKMSLPEPPRHLNKVALVIGNNNYQSATPLRNAINDADGITRTLVSLGFQVKTVTNADYRTMRQEVLDYGKRTEGADVSFFFFAGHGLEVEGENFLVPVDAVIKDAQDISKVSLSAKWLLRMIKFTNDDNLNIVVLDACRNNPYPNGSRSAGGGLARMTPPSGMVVAYSTAPGQVASDGNQGNGLYTGELIKQMNIAQRIEDVFMKTRNEVERISAGRQRPWEEARLRNVFYLKY